MNVLDLFSGIGGFSLGLERAGMRTVAFCERDEYCRAVLRKHWPDVPCFDDIHSIDADGLDRLGRIDLVCGGFPCQPFSVAGKQRAQADDRHLWPEMRRVIALARPTWVVGENVTGLIALALDDVLADLEALGYAARTFVIPAVAVDAKHRRDRVWIVARDTNVDRQPAGAINAEEVAKLRGSTADADRVQHEGGSHAKRWPGAAELSAPYPAAMQRRSIQWDESNGALPSDGAVAYAEHSGCQGRNTEWRGPDSTNAPCRWLTEPDVGRVAHGVPRRVDRLRCLGNAVVPQIVEEIGRAILAVSK